MSSDKIQDSFTPKKDVRLFFKYIKGTPNEEHKDLGALKRTLIQLGYIEDAGAGMSIQLKNLPKDVNQIIEEMIVHTNMITRSEK